ncbi:2OG-Fe oxygenase superfamily protein [Pochonia chlamydosporia 170]|uniref:2OG-Fe oxygenase superfamily protein n=1 Tax=Pochonia chlamydosporia 170 TaxID=1380566 RepID=A0A179FTH9_METCM|nr:2OG-Fe oxygenase superfamily protein [Pochonia chlamydosporia 170]OAQ68912.1 2OG-Fe oxygenase superfamily protein [Pochonia chlamydosporia 170]
MATATQTGTTQIRVASPTGPVTRTILRTPLRDALPSEIPIIDVSPIFSSSLEDRKSVAQQVRNAATNTGFFYIKNHGVPNHVTQESYNAALEFFRQDVDKKNEASITKSARYNGYRAPDTQRVNPDEGIDVRESFSITYDPRIDTEVNKVQEIPENVMEYIRMEEGHWENTSNLPNFKCSVINHYQSCLSLARALTRTFALSLDLPETAFDSKVVYPDAGINMNYYPPIPNNQSLTPTDPNARVSIGSHTDFPVFTILWQDNVGGLQVLSRDGQWINAKPIPDTFVVNIADCLQRITNDKYVSTIHRAQNWSGKERVSIGFFWGFGFHETCAVLDNCLAPGEKKKYEDINCWEWLKKRVYDMTQLDEECKKSS